MIGRVLRHGLGSQSVAKYSPISCHPARKVSRFRRCCGVHGEIGVEFTRLVARLLARLGARLGALASSWGAAWDLSAVAARRPFP